MNIAAQPPTALDLAAVKSMQHATWSCGDYAAVGTTLQIVGERLAETLDLRPDTRVLDVAAGNGNATLAAARRCCNVVSTDYVSTLLKAGMARAEAERLTVAFRQADAEDLPFEASSFDTVISTFGVMFTANQEAAASELLRVCRSGGKIGFANWTPDSFVGDVFRALGRHAPPPSGVRSPMEWGTQERLNELFADQASRIDITFKEFVFRFRSPAYWVEHWRNVYGPAQKAFQTAGDNAPALEADLIALAQEASRDDIAMIVPARYAEVIVHRK